MRVNLAAPQKLISLQPTPSCFEIFVFQFTEHLEVCAATQPRAASPAKNSKMGESEWREGGVDDTYMEDESERKRG